MVETIYRALVALLLAVAWSFGLFALWSLGAVWAAWLGAVLGVVVLSWYLLATRRGHG